MPEIAKRQSTDVKDGKKGYKLVYYKDGHPFTYFATDEASNEQQALNMFLYYAQDQLKQIGLKKSDILRDMYIQEIPFEEANEEAKKFGMKNGLVTLIPKASSESKKDFDDPADWKDGAIDVDFKEITEPKELDFDDKEIDEVINAGKLKEQVTNEDVRYVKEKYLKLGLRLDDKAFKYIESLKEPNLIKSRLLGYILGTVETLKYENDELKKMLNEKRGY